MASTPDTLTRARAGDEAAFRALTEPHRRELQLHCYRILGSAQDAEDLVQETLLAAWRGLDGFEGRASLRAWLYRIASNRCLNALRDRGRRPRELPLPPEPSPAPPQPTRMGEPVWLEPYPDAWLEDTTAGPEAAYEARESVSLAFVAALQHLRPRQRAVLVLRDVLGFRAAEVAEMLDGTEASVNGALNRARSAIATRLPAGGRAEAPLPRSPQERELVGRFADAFQAGDIAGVVALLTDDAWLTMPPEPLEYQGPAAIKRFLSTVPAGGALHRIRLVPTRANLQPAFGCYLRDRQAPIAHAYGLMVLTVEGERVSAITGFIDSGVFAAFGLPRTIPCDDA